MQSPPFALAMTLCLTVGCAARRDAPPAPTYSNVARLVNVEILVPNGTTLAPPFHLPVRMTVAANMPPDGEVKLWYCTSRQVEPPHVGGELCVRQTKTASTFVRPYRIDAPLSVSPCEVLTFTYFHLFILGADQSFPSDLRFPETYQDKTSVPITIHTPILQVPPGVARAPKC